MKYELACKNALIHVHKAGCKDIAKIFDRWTNEAVNTAELIEKEKQAFYENAGGTGDYKLDTDLDHEPRSYAEQEFYILPCVK